MKIYIGFDKKNVLAYEVCVASLVKHATIPLDIIPVKDWILRRDKLFWRSSIIDEKGQNVDRTDRSAFSTDFSFTRFCVPSMAEYKDEWVLFIDSDIMFRSDIAEVVKHLDDQHSVFCVQHEHKPYEESKMFGLKQTYYRRKNWSSFMFMNPAKCSGLTPYAVNNWSGESLHAMLWVDDGLIGSLPKKWNYLLNCMEPINDPAVVHFTLGTPDMLPATHTCAHTNEWWRYARNIELYSQGTYYHVPE